MWFVRSQPDGHVAFAWSDQHALVSAWSGERACALCVVGLTGMRFAESQILIVSPKLDRNREAETETPGVVVVDWCTTGARCPGFKL